MTYFAGGAFSTEMKDEAVVTLGNMDEARNSDHMQPLRNGDRIYSTVRAFVAALKLWLTHDLVRWAQPSLCQYRFITLCLIMSCLIDNWTCSTGSLFHFLVCELIYNFWWGVILFKMPIV